MFSIVCGKRYFVFIFIFYNFLNDNLNQRRETSRGPARDPTPIPSTIEQNMMEPAISCSFSGSFWGPSIHEIFIRYPPENPKQETNIAYAQSDLNKISVVLLYGATLQNMVRKMNTVLRRTERRRNMSVRLPPLGHFVMFDKFRPIKSKKENKKNEQTRTKNLSFQAVCSVEIGLTRAAMAGMKEMVCVKVSKITKRFTHKLFRMVITSLRSMNESCCLCSVYLR